MSRRTFTHVPEETMDCGVLGCHAAEFTAIIDSEQNRFGWDHKVQIVKVLVDIRVGQNVLTIPVTEIFTEKDSTREKWEEEIRKDYVGIMNGKLEEYG